MAGLGEKKVLISDSISKICQETLTSAGFTVDYRPGISKEDLIACIKVLHLLHCTNKGLTFIKL